MGPTRKARDHRDVNNHLADGGIFFVTRSPDDVVALANRGGRERTTELGRC